MAGISTLVRKNVLGPAAGLAIALIGPGGAPGAETVKPEARETLLPIYLSANEAIVMLHLKDRAPAPVIFDTGTNGNLLDVAFAHQIGLSTREASDEARDGATGKVVPGFVTDLTDARLGGALIVTPETQVIPLTSDAPGAAPEVVGIFGPNSFVGRLLYLDLANARVVILDKVPSAIPTGRAYPYLGRPGHRLPAIDAEVAGKRVPLVLDTGSDRPTIDLPLAMAKQTPLIGQLRQIGVGHSIGGDQPVYEGRVRGIIRVGELILHNPTVTFSGSIAGVGLPLIRRMTLLLDPEGERTWAMTPQSVPAAKFTSYAGRYGERAIEVKRGSLFFHRDGQPPVQMRPLAPDFFELSNGATLVRFQRADGRIVGLDRILDDGEVLPDPRTD